MQNTWKIYQYVKTVLKRIKYTRKWKMKKQKKILCCIFLIILTVFALNLENYATSDQDLSNINKQIE